MTYILLFLINLIPGCKFRTSEEVEIVGVDEAEVSRLSVLAARLERSLPSRLSLPLSLSKSSDSQLPLQLGEFAYDYLELRKDISDHELYSTSPTLTTTGDERGRPTDGRTATSASHESKEGVEGKVSQVPGA